MFEFLESAFESKLLWIAAVFLMIYVSLKKFIYSYWQKHGVPHDNYTVPFGILDRRTFFGKITIGDLFKESYEKLKKYPFYGIYICHMKYLIINDPDLIKQILVKEFSNFCDRGVYANTKYDPISGHIFFLEGDKWKYLRAKLTPTFTGGKLKQIFPIIRDIADKMIEVADESLMKTDILEMKDLVARYTTDTIFSIAFGVDSNCLENIDNKFRYFGNKSVESDQLRFALAFFVPVILDTLRIPFTLPEVSNFFINLFKDMVNKRRMETNTRNDFLNMLIELMDKEQIFEENTEKNFKKDGIDSESVKKRLELIEATAQAFAFFIAGFETSSSIVTHCLYELALNPDVQVKVHEEIDKFSQNSNQLNYNNFEQLEYLNMTFYEAMRKHPSVPILNRICMNGYQIPNSDYYIPKGMRIIISISALHKDPNYFPDPERFDPTRFSKENIATRHPFVYLPFGEGPRNCIGKRLGVIQSKIALFNLLSNYKFSVCEKTPIPLRYSNKSILQSPGDSIYLRVERRKMK